MIRSGASLCFLRSRVERGDVRRSTTGRVAVNAECCRPGVSMKILNGVSMMILLVPLISLLPRQAALRFRHEK